MGTEGFDWLKKGLKSRSESEDLDDAVLVAAIDWVFRFAAIRFQWFQYSTSHLVRNSWRSVVSEGGIFRGFVLYVRRISSSVIRNEAEYKHSANNGLKIAIDLCEEVKAKHPKITYADLYQLTGGPTIDFAPGRKDSMVSPEEGRLPAANKVLDMCYKHSGIPKLSNKTLKSCSLRLFHKAILKSFDDIGAFERMKETLKESVMLHLQRPELFTKCQLTKTTQYRMPSRRSTLWDESEGPSHYSGHGKG
ncbi:hypothetical protein CASFOL_013709 [Castilleja foliolosa]|uniref:Plant heme peroxidase family profile domain-containing protein n=1 Tax=Castilleja foliolosa TaxID=1961234 RepID=A0ABD3DPN5_9LAMI